MTPVETEVVRRKLSVIVDNLQALKPVAKMDLATYVSDLFRRKGTERLLQELIEAAIDINMHIITGLGGGVPDDYFDSFLKLGETGVLTPDLARDLAPSAGLRNRLVHEYDRLDDAIILESVSTCQKHYTAFVGAINKYLSGKDETS